MKRILLAVLMTGAIFSVLSSCSTVPKGPLGAGELRLINMDVPEGGILRMGVAYPVTINFEAEGNPEIGRACFYWSGDGPYCVKVTDVKYGSRGNFQVPIFARFSSERLECYAEYLRDGKLQRTNLVGSFVTGIMR